MKYEFNAITYFIKMRTLLYSENIGKRSWRYQRHGIVNLFQFSLMTVLKHRHSSAFLSTEAAHSRRFHFFFTTWFPVFLETTHINLCLLLFGPLSLMFPVFAWLSVSFLPLSVIFQVLLFAVPQVIFPGIFLFQSFTVPQKVDSDISVFLNREILTAFSSKRSASWLTNPPDSVIVCKLTSCLLAAAQNLHITKMRLSMYSVQYKLPHHFYCRCVCISLFLPAFVFFPLDFLLRTNTL